MTGGGETYATADDGCRLWTERPGVTLEPSGHLPWLDEPAVFAAALREFVS